MIEFVLVAPFLVLIMLGVLEYGNAWRQVGTIERAVQQGARSASSQADGRYADYEALRSIDAATRGLPGISVDRVIIYNATQADGQVPNAACFTGDVSGVCNNYTGDQVRTTSPAGFPGAHPTNPVCAGGSWDQSWCPVNRDRDGADRVRIGVHLTVTYSPVTGLLPGDVTIQKHAVYVIEPCAQGQSTC